MCLAVQTTFVVTTIKVVEESLLFLQFLYSFAQGLLRDAEHRCSCGLVIASSLHGFLNEHSCRFFDGWQWIGKGYWNSRMFVILMVFCFGSARPGDMAAEDIQREDAIVVLSYCIKNHGLKFPDVAGKVVGFEKKEEFLRQSRLFLLSVSDAHWAK